MERNFSILWDSQYHPARSHLAELTRVQDGTGRIYSACAVVADLETGRTYRAIFARDRTPQWERAQGAKAAVDSLCLLLDGRALPDSHKAELRTWALARFQDLYRAALAVDFDPARYPLADAPQSPLLDRQADAQAERLAVKNRALQANRAASPDVLAQYRADLEAAPAVAFLAGDGIQAVGAIVLRESPGALHPWRVHFLNLQSGGYHGGNYCGTYADGLAAFADKLQRYDPTQGLRDAAQAQGLNLETVSNGEAA